MEKKKIILIAFTAIFAVSVAILGFQYFSVYRQLQQAQKEAKVQQLNVKIINFLLSFIRDVLKTNDEISFEKRLKLENAVRDLGDKKVLAQWEKFVASKTEAEAQDNVKELLDLLVSKISY